MPTSSFGAPSQPGYATGGGFFSSSTSAPTEPILPEWLPTDPNANNSELMDQYSSIGNFGANKAARAIDRRSAINTSMGMQAANNAGTDYANRLMQAGGTAFATGAVKAQAMLPVLKQAADSEVSKQAMLMDAKKTAAQMRQNVAGQLAQSRQSYLGMLAGTYTTMRGQNIQSDAYGRSQTAASRSGLAPVPGGGMISPGGQPFMPGYIPNQGPIDPSTGWAGSNGNNVLLDPTIPYRSR